MTADAETIVAGLESSVSAPRLVDHDTMRVWRVDAASVRTGDGVADAEVRGSGRQLLAWLVGRGGHGLEVSGKADRLPDLPAYG